MQKLYALLLFCLLAGCFDATIFSSYTPFEGGNRNGASDASSAKLMTLKSEVISYFQNGKKSSVMGFIVEYENVASAQNAVASYRCSISIRKGPSGSAPIAYLEGRLVWMATNIQTWVACVIPIDKINKNRGALKQYIDAGDSSEYTLKISTRENQND